ncbi:hypothetical protein MMC18_002825 [Xylographa bjoerkii]|nr:hypothetical protein [Xylographa bjoerkii]
MPAKPQVKYPPMTSKQAKATFEQSGRPQPSAWQAGVWARQNVLLKRAQTIMDKHEQSTANKQKRDKLKAKQIQERLKRAYRLWKRVISVLGRQGYNVEDEENIVDLNIEDEAYPEFPGDSDHYMMKSLQYVGDPLAGQDRGHTEITEPRFPPIHSGDNDQNNDLDKREPAQCRLRLLKDEVQANLTGSDSQTEQDVPEIPSPKLPRVPRPKIPRTPTRATRLSASRIISYRMTKRYSANPLVKEQRSSSDMDLAEALLAELHAEDVSFSNGEVFDGILGGNEIEPIEAAAIDSLSNSNNTLHHIHISEEAGKIEELHTTKTAGAIQQSSGKKVSKDSVEQVYASVKQNKDYQRELSEEDIAFVTNGFSSRHAPYRSSKSAIKNKVVEHEQTHELISKAASLASHNGGNIAIVGEVRTTNDKKLVDRTNVSKKNSFE